jgi:hypothetical protein
MFNIQTTGSSMSLSAEMNTTRSKRAFIYITAALSFVILAAAIWIPVGIQRTALIDEWTVVTVIDSGQPLFINTITYEIPDRSFSMLSYYLGYLLTPDSFAGLNIVFLLTFIFKGIFFWGIVHRFFPSIPTFSLFVSLLYVVYPADTAILSTRPINYHWSILFMLIAINLLLMYWKRRRRVFMLAIWIAQAVAISNIEVGLPIIMAAPGLLLLKEKKITPRLIRTALLWYAMPAFFIIALAIALINQSYQFNTLAHEGDPAQLRIPIYAGFMGFALYRSFLHGWIEAVSMIAKNATPSFYIAAILSTAVFIIFGVSYFRQLNWKPRSINRRLYERIAWLGLAILVTGYLAVLPTPHRSTFERTLLFSSMGTVLTLGAILLILTRLAKSPNMVFTCLFGFIMGIAVLAAIVRYQEMFAYSVQQQKLLAEIATQMPRFDTQAAIILFDETHALEKTQWLWGTNATSRIFERALQFMYNDYSIRARLCYPNEPERPIFPERCEVDADQITAYIPGHPTIQRSYDQIIALSYTDTGDIKVLDKLPDSLFHDYDINTYNPHKFIDSSAQLPERVQPLTFNYQQVTD